MTLRALARKMQRTIDDYRRQRGLPDNYDVTTPHAPLIVSIDEFLCRTCDDFMGSDGCLNHPA